MANNGDLNGGHLNHTGPVYPADGWGDIIPPYVYVDKNGQAQTFPGYNWTRPGRRSGERLRAACPTNAEAVIPVVECVESSRGRFLAHGGTGTRTARRSKRRATRTPSRPPRRPRPADSSPQTASRTRFQVEWTAPSSPGSSREHGVRHRSSKMPRRLDDDHEAARPQSDPGRFAQRIDGEVAGGAEAVGDGGSTGTIAVPPGGAR